MSEPPSELPIRAVEERLLRAESSEEIVLWTQVRGELLRQNDLQQEQEHRRALEKLQVRFKMGFSVGTVVTGIGLTFLEFPTVGLFLLGAGLYGVVPDYVKDLFRRKREHGDE